MKNPGSVCVCMYVCTRVSWTCSLPWIELTQLTSDEIIQWMENSNLYIAYSSVSIWASAGSVLLTVELIPEAPAPGWVGLKQRQCLNVWIHCLTSLPTELFCRSPELRCFKNHLAATEFALVFLITLHVPLTIDWQIHVSWQDPRNKRIYCFPPWLAALSSRHVLKQCAHYRCSLLFIYYCLSRGVLWKLAHILSVPFFSILPFFACCSSCFFPSSNPLFPSVDTTATTEPAVHGWYHIPVYLLSQRCWEARQAWEKEKCSLQGNSRSK